MPRSKKTGNEVFLPFSDEGGDVACDRPNRIRFRLGACRDVSNLTGGYARHSNRVLSRLRGDCNRILSVTRESFLSEKKPVSNLLEDSFQLFASLSLPFSYNLLGLDPFPWNVYAIADNPYISMTHP